MNRPGKPHSRQKRSTSQHTAAPRTLDPIPGYGSVEQTAVLELTRTLFATLDSKGRIQSCSGTWEQHLNRGRERLVGHTILELIRPEDHPVFQRALSQLLGGQPAEEFTVRMPRPDAPTAWLSLRLRLNPGNESIHLVAREVTIERLFSNEAARANLILDEINDGVLVADTTRDDLTILLANAGFSRLTGYPREQAIGRPLDFAAGPKTDRPALEAAIATVRRGQRIEAEIYLHRTDGTPVWIWLKLSPIFDHDGSVCQIIAVLKDISEHRLTLEALRSKNADLARALQSLQHTEEAIVQRERMHALGKMASGIVHDFNNLLAPILGFAELMITVPELAKDADKVAAYMKKIQSAATDGAAVVSRLRDFYRTRKDNEDAEFSVQSAVTETLALTHHLWRNEAQATSRPVEIVTELEDTPSVRGSAPEIRQALTNLVLNAVDAMPDGGKIRVRTHAVDDWICIQISDVGAGMSEEVRQRCIEPFFTTKGNAGTGLGLATVFGTVERHHGRIDIHSVEGQGTTISLWLPAASSLPGAPDLMEAPFDEISSRPLALLIIDDEDLFLEVVSQMAVGMGHTVDASTSPQQALELYYKKPYDLVITDRAMPGMSGDQLAHSIREYKPDASIVLLTGFGDFIRDSGEKLDHFDEILSKPLSYESLGKTLARFGGRGTPRTPAA